MRRTLALGVLLAALGAGPAAAGGEKAADFSGTWNATFGDLVFKQAGDEATGVYGSAGQFTMKGKVEGRKLSAKYVENGVDGEATFEMSESGSSMKGAFFIPSTERRGEWSGWRPDPKAVEGPAASLSGMYLTRQGLFEIVQKGDKAEGTWSAYGPVKVKGDVKGRRLTLRYEGVFKGSGWVELGKDKKSVAGALKDDRGGGGWFGFGGKAVATWIHHPKLKPGAIVDGATSGMMTYYARAPEGWAPGKPVPAVVLFHGSNMNAKMYVNTFANAWPDLAKRFLVVGIDGERWVEPEKDTGKADEPIFNYTYVNFMGRSTYKGFPGTDRESPSLVVEALDELKKEWNVSKWIAGGHSQGGFLTYILATHFPERLAGAFPISSGVVIQAEPDVFDDDGLKTAQRRLPIAIVHARNDGVVPFSSSEYGYGRFAEFGFPALRLVAHDTAAHMFAVLPVDEAVRWIDALSSDDPEALATFGEAQAKALAWRDAVAAVVRAKSLTKGKGTPRISALESKVSEACKPLVARLLPLVEKNANGAWIDDVLAFRDQFEFAEAGKPLMDAFGKVRAEQQPAAEDSMKSARRALSENEQDDGYAAYKTIVEKQYASTWYRLAKLWISQRK